MRAETVGGRGVLCALLLLMLSAPALATTANDLCAANADPCVVATPVAVTNSSVIDVGTRELRIDSRRGARRRQRHDDASMPAGSPSTANGFVRAPGTSATSGGTHQHRHGGRDGDRGQHRRARRARRHHQPDQPAATSRSAAALDQPRPHRARAVDLEVGGTINVTAASADPAGSSRCSAAPTPSVATSRSTTTELRRHHRYDRRDRRRRRLDRHRSRRAHRAPATSRSAIRDA